MDGLAIAALAFAAGVLLGGGGAYVVLVRGRSRKDVESFMREVARMDGDIRKMDRNFRLFLEDCKSMAGQCSESMAASSAGIDRIALDVHAKLSSQGDALAGIDGTVRQLAASVPERFDVLDGAHGEIGADVARILDRVKEIV